MSAICLNATGFLPVTPIPLEKYSIKKHSIFVEQFVLLCTLLCTRNWIRMHRYNLLKHSGFYFIVRLTLWKRAGHIALFLSRVKAVKAAE